MTSACLYLQVHDFLIQCSKFLPPKHSKKMENGLKYHATKFDKIAVGVT
jgi:hypothetical protein